MVRIFALVFVLVLASVAQAADLRLGVDVVSGYVWRGQAIGSASAAAIQPSTVLTAGDFSVSARTNSFIQQRDVLGSISEVQVVAMQTFTLERDASLSVACRQDFYAKSDSDTATEVSAGLSIPVPLSPQLAVHYNFADFGRWGYDWYVSLSGGHVIRCVNVSGTLGLADDGGWLDFHDAEIRVARTFSFRHVDVSPHVRFAVLGRDSHHWIFGANFSLR